MAEVLKFAPSEDPYPGHTQDPCLSQEGVCSCGSCTPGDDINALSLIQAGDIGIGPGLVYFDTKPTIDEPELAPDQVEETDEPRRRCDHHEPHEEGMCSCGSDHGRDHEDASSSGESCSCCHDSEVESPEPLQNTEVCAEDHDFSTIQDEEARALLKKRYESYCLDEGDDPETDTYFKIHLRTKGGNGQPRRILTQEIRHARVNLDPSSERYTQLERHWNALGMDPALLPQEKNDLAAFFYTCLMKTDPKTRETMLHIEDPAYALMFDDFEIYHSPELLGKYEYVDEFYEEALAEAQRINTVGTTEEKKQLIISADGCCDTYHPTITDLHFHGTWGSDNKARLLIPLALIGFEEAEMMLHLLAQERDNPVYPELGKALADIPRDQLAMELSKMVVARIEQKQAEQQAKETARAEGKDIIELENTWESRYSVIAGNIVLLANHVDKLDEQTREILQRVASPKYIGWQIRTYEQNPFEQHNSDMTEIFLQELRQQRLEQHAADNPEGIVRALARLSPELQDEEVVSQLEETRSDILQAGIPDDVRHISYILTLATELQTRPVPDGGEIQLSEEESRILELAEQLNQRGHYLAHYLPEEGHPEGYHFAVGANGRPEACGDCTHATDQQLEQIQQEVQQATEHIDLNEPRQQAETVQEQQDPPTPADLRAEPDLPPELPAGAVLDGGGGQPDNTQTAGGGLPETDPDGTARGNNTDDDFPPNDKQGGGVDPYLYAYPYGYYQRGDDLLSGRSGGHQRSEPLPPRVGVQRLDIPPRGGDRSSSRSSGSDGRGGGNGSRGESIVNVDSREGREGARVALLAGAVGALVGVGRTERGGGSPTQRREVSAESLITESVENNTKAAMVIHDTGSETVQQNQTAVAESEENSELCFSPDIQVDSILGRALVTAYPNATGKPTESYSLRVYRDGSYMVSTNGTSRAMSVTTSFSHSSGETYTIKLYHGSELLKSSDWTPEANSLIAPNQSKQSPSASQPSRKSIPPVLPIQVINQEGEITTIIPPLSQSYEMGTPPQKEPDIGTMIAKAMRATESEASPVGPAVAEGPAGRGEMRGTVDIDSSPRVAAKPDTDASPAAPADQVDETGQAELRAEDKPVDSYTLSPQPESDDPAGGSMATELQADATTESLRLGGENGGESFALKEPATATKAQRVDMVGNGGGGSGGLALEETTEVSATQQRAQAERTQQTLGISDTDSGEGAGMERQLPAQQQRMKLDGSDSDNPGGIAMRNQPQKQQMGIGASADGGSGGGMAQEVQGEAATIEAGAGSGGGGSRVIQTRETNKATMTAGNGNGPDDGLTVNAPEVQEGRTGERRQEEGVKGSKVQGRREGVRRQESGVRSEETGERSQKTESGARDVASRTGQSVGNWSTPTARQAHRIIQQSEAVQGKATSDSQQLAEKTRSPASSSIPAEPGTNEAVEGRTTPAQSLRQRRAARRAAASGAQSVGPSDNQSGDSAAHTQPVTDSPPDLQVEESQQQKVELTQRKAQWASPVELKMKEQIKQEAKTVQRRTRTGKAAEAKQLEVRSTPNVLDMKLPAQAAAKELGFTGKIRMMQPPLNKYVREPDMNAFRRVLQSMGELRQGHVIMVGWKVVGKFAVPILTIARDAREARSHLRADRRRAVSPMEMKHARAIAHAA